MRAATYSVCLPGHLLRRGFWLYVWEVRFGKKTVYYVGRTGDSSSRYASSPMSRLGQHLSVQASATANMLIRNLRTNKIDPYRSVFQMFAFGPLFGEQRNLTEHRKYRNIMAPIERDLAIHLKERGLTVLGSHPRKGKADRKLLSRVTRQFDLLVRRA